MKRVVVVVVLTKMISSAIVVAAYENITGSCARRSRGLGYQG